MSILFFSSKPYDQEFFTKENTSTSYNFSLKFLEIALDEATCHVIPSEGIDAVCVFVNDVVNRAVIEKLAEKQVKIIALRCAGFNNVDLVAAKEFGIVVCRVPAYSPEAVAEHTIAMIMTLNRKTHKAYNRVREQNFSLNGLLGFNLHKRTIGVMGTGKIGKAFIKIALGFGANVVCYDLYPDVNISQECGPNVQYVATRDELFAQSDIISLHLPLTKENFHMINEENIAKMKDGVMIINTSRGALINTADAIKGLKSRKIGYLGIDVYEHEEDVFFKDLTGKIIEDDTIQRLMSFPNVLVTSHQAFFTEEALTQISSVTLNNIHSIKTTGTADKCVLL